MCFFFSSWINVFGEKTRNFYFLEIKNKKQVYMTIMFDYDEENYDSDDDAVHYF